MSSVLQDTSPSTPTLLLPPSLECWPPEAPESLPCLFLRNKESVPDDTESSGTQLHFKEMPGGSPHLQGRVGEGKSLPATK